MVAGVIGLLLFASGLAAGETPAAIQLIKDHCVNCHGAGKKHESIFGDILNINNLIQRKIIVPGQPSQSPLIQEVESGLMPQTGRALTPDEIKVLSLFVKNLPAQPQSVACATRSRITNLVTLDYRAQKSTNNNLRYFVLPGDKIDLHRKALLRIINSIHWQPHLVRLYPINNEGTILRLDLREMGWRDEDWRRVTSDYPYRDLNFKSLFPSGVDFPVVNSGWFINEVSQGQKYYRALNITNLDALKRYLQVDNPNTKGSLRSGFRNSGVSRNNRVIERLQQKFGSYWQSYDFLATKGQDRRNIFAFPDNFVEDGGEAIFSLPNGLFGFALYSQGGNLLTVAPVDVVQDPRRPDKVVRNGVSCMGCHSAGYIPRNDDLLAFVKNAQTQFQTRQIEFVLSRHRADEVRTAIVTDSQDYLKALRALDIDPNKDPVNDVVDDFEADLSLSQAACEVGVKPEVLTSYIREKAGTLGEINTLLMEPRPFVPRALFQNVVYRLGEMLPIPLPIYQQIKKLNLATPLESLIIAEIAEGRYTFNQLQQTVEGLKIAGVDAFAIADRLLRSGKANSVDLAFLGVLLSQQLPNDENFKRALEILEATTFGQLDKKEITDLIVRFSGKLTLSQIQSISENQLPEPVISGLVDLVAIHLPIADQRLNTAIEIAKWRNTGELSAECLSKFAIAEPLAGQFEMIANFLRRHRGQCALAVATLDDIKEKYNWSKSTPAEVITIVTDVIDHRYNQRRLKDHLRLLGPYLTLTQIRTQLLEPHIPGYAELLAGLLSREPATEALKAASDIRHLFTGDPNIIPKIQTLLISFDPQLKFEHVLRLATSKPSPELVTALTEITKVGKPQTQADFDATVEIADRIQSGTISSDCAKGFLAVALYNQNLPKLKNLLLGPIRSNCKLGLETLATIRKYYDLSKVLADEISLVLADVVTSKYSLNRLNQFIARFSKQMDLTDVRIALLDLEFDNFDELLAFLLKSGGKSTAHRFTRNVAQGKYTAEKVRAFFDTLYPTLSAAQIETLLANGEVLVPQDAILVAKDYRGAGDLGKLYDLAKKISKASTKSGIPIRNFSSFLLRGYALYCQDHFNAKDQTALCFRAQYAFHAMMQPTTIIALTHHIVKVVNAGRMKIKGDESDFIYPALDLLFAEFEPQKVLNFVNFEDIEKLLINQGSPLSPGLRDQIQQIANITDSSVALLYTISKIGNDRELSYSESNLKFLYEMKISLRAWKKISDLKLGDFNNLVRNFRSLEPRLHPSAIWNPYNYWINSSDHLRKMRTNLVEALVAANNSPSYTRYLEENLGSGDIPKPNDLRSRGLIY